MNEERDKLIEELHNIEVKTPDGMKTKHIGSLVKYWHLKAIANFIISDRKRIVEPLIKANTNKYGCLIVENKAVKETLKLAGVK